MDDFGDGIIIGFFVTLLIGALLVGGYESTFNHTQQYGQSICDYTYGTNTTIYVGYDTTNQIVQCKENPVIKADKFDGIHVRIVKGD